LTICDVVAQILYYIKVNSPWPPTITSNGATNWCVMVALHFGFFIFKK